MYVLVNSRALISSASVESVVPYSSSSVTAAIPSAPGGSGTSARRARPPFIFRVLLAHQSWRGGGGSSGADIASSRKATPIATRPATSAAASSPSASESRARSGAICASAATMRCRRASSRRTAAVGTSPRASPRLRASSRMTAAGTERRRGSSSRCCLRCDARSIASRLASSTVLARGCAPKYAASTDSTISMEKPAAVAACTAAEDCSVRFSSHSASRLRRSRWRTPRTAQATPATMRRAAAMAPRATLPGMRGAATTLSLKLYIACELRFRELYPYTLWSPSF